jgi:hypothetical protein
MSLTPPCGKLQKSKELSQPNNTYAKRHLNFLNSKKVTWIFSFYLITVKHGEGPHKSEELTIIEINRLELEN